VQPYAAADNAERNQLQALQGVQIVEDVEIVTMLVHEA
jgi:hypothetical protein